MEITNIRIRKTIDNSKLKGIVSITFDDCFCVHDIKIVENYGKIFLAMPSAKLLNGEFRDVVHPINFEFRQKIETEVLKEYEANISHNE